VLIIAKEGKNKIMRKDLQKSLKHGHIDPFQLSTFQRIMLTTDGTLTEIMEAYLLEKIQVAKLSQEFITLEKGIIPLNLRKGSTVIERKILLQGKVSGTNFVYAESIIVPERFDKKVQEELEKSKKPIGQLWLEYKIETFREIIASGKEPADEVADYFHISKDQFVLFRTYLVFVNKKPIMMITEKFPESFFLNTF
jgi:chorismate-pyruvate lyase